MRFFVSLGVRLGSLAPLALAAFLFLLLEFQLLLQVFWVAPERLIRVHRVVFHLLASAHGAVVRAKVLGGLRIDDAVARLVNPPSAGLAPDPLLEFDKRTCFFSANGTYL